jgi:microcystin-dependent protein
MSAGISNYNTQTGLSFNNPEYPRIGNYSCNTCSSSSSGGCCLPIGSVVAYTKTDVLFPNLLIDGATWNICDGGNGTVDLRNQFIYGNDTNPNLGTTGGSANHTIIPSDIPLHSHTVPALPVPITITAITVPAQTITSLPLVGATITGSVSGTTNPPSGVNHRHQAPGSGLNDYVINPTGGGGYPAAGGLGGLGTTQVWAPETGDINGSVGDLASHTHSFSSTITGGTITGGTSSGATTAGAPIPITGSSTGTVSVPTTGISPGQTTQVPTIPPYTKLYYIERTA